MVCNNIILLQSAYVINILLIRLSNIQGNLNVRKIKKFIVYVKYVYVVHVLAFNEFHAYTGQTSNHKYFGTFISFIHIFILLHHDLFEIIVRGFFFQSMINIKP